MLSTINEIIKGIRKYLTSSHVFLCNSICYSHRNHLHSLYLLPLVTYTFSDYLIRFCLFILYTYFYIKVNIFCAFIIFLFSNVPKKDCTLKSTIPFLLCICFHYIYSLYFLFTFASFYDEEYNHKGCDCADCDPHYDWIIIAGLCAL